MGVSYSLLGTDFTVNNNWAAAGQSSSAERQMKSALKRGSYGQLDLYFLSDLGGGLLGFCYFPVASPSSSQRVLDGCINLAASLPGAEATNYDMGLTAVHEVGHWFGLYVSLNTLRMCCCRRRSDRGSIWWLPELFVTNAVRNFPRH